MFPPMIFVCIPNVFSFKCFRHGLQSFPHVLQYFPSVCPHGFRCVPHGSQCSPHPPPTPAPPPCLLMFFQIPPQKMFPKVLHVFRLPMASNVPPLPTFFPMLLPWFPMFSPWPPYHVFLYFPKVFSCSVFPMASTVDNWASHISACRNEPKESRFSCHKCFGPSPEEVASGTGVRGRSLEDPQTNEGFSGEGQVIELHALLKATACGPLCSCFPGGLLAQGMFLMLLCQRVCLRSLGRLGWQQASSTCTPLSP